MARRTSLQLALDLEDTARAVTLAQATADSIDIVEAGTVLVLAQGLSAVRSLREAVPDRPLCADIRIARAGEKFAEMVFAAGADRVTVIGEAPQDVVAGALTAAERHHAEVEVELFEAFSRDDVHRWVESGVSRLIAHRPSGVSAADDHTTRTALERLRGCNLGGTTITVAGGIDFDDTTYFLPGSFDTIAVGSTITAASDPQQAAARIRADLDRVTEASHATV